MLIKTAKGLYCPAGDFFIDPSGAVDHAVITHAHSDHARRGSRHYYCVPSGKALLKARLGNIAITTIPYGKLFEFNQVKVSFHPAGHMLGSSQVRIEFCGEVWVVSGDYKRIHDPSCESFEVVPCDVFITEATFGTKKYSWQRNIEYGAEIFDWWQSNAKRNVNSVLYAYSLGKSQRILASLAPYQSDHIFCDEIVERINVCYRENGIQLPHTQTIQEIEKSLMGALFIVPPGKSNIDKRSTFGRDYQTAFASGWMANLHYYRYDHGFTMSDHADWDDLVATILATGAERIYVQHRGAGSLVRHLKLLGKKAFADTALVPKNPQQLAFL